MDSLSALLSAFRLDVDIIHNAQYCGEWAVDTSGLGYVSFHLVTYGECHAESECMDAPLLLKTGDFILFPHDSPHSLKNDQACSVVVNQQDSIAYEEGLKSNGVGLMCGYFKFSHPISNPLLTVLPSVLIKRQDDLKNDASIGFLLNLIKEEALAKKQGYQISLNRLTETLFIQIIRETINQGEALSGIAAALSNPRLSKSLDAIHSMPEKKWTVDELAKLAAMSRSSFAEQFKQLMGMTPMNYLGQWRMQKAWGWLNENGESVYSVALKCGYDTESSFSKAFKRYMGVSPGETRKPIKNTS